MSHLPPRPDFADHPPHPSRPDGRSHYYSRPTPMAPEHLYRERERDVYISGRSPPRSKPPGRMPDSYIAADRDRDYPPREPPYPPPPGYDRREHDDRHRDTYRGERGWERRDYRDYPPHVDNRYREQDPRAWTRDSRDRGRPRWEDTARPVFTRGARKSPPRSWTQSDEIDRHPRGARFREPPRDEDRRWQTRPGRSPPRRYESNPASPRASTSQRRWEERAARRDYRSRSRSPVRSPVKSAAMSPRDRRRRSRSYSPRRRDRGRTPDRNGTPRTRTDYERVPLDTQRDLDTAMADDTEPEPGQLQPSPEPTPVDSRPRPTAMAKDSAPAERLPALKLDTPLLSGEKSKEPSVAPERDGKKAPSVGSVTPQQPTGELQSTSRPRSPPNAVRSALKTELKTPVTPMSPQGRSPLISLPPKPEWASTSQSTPSAPAAEPPVDAPAEDEYAIIKAELKEKFGIDLTKDKEKPFWADVEGELDWLRSHQRRLESDYYVAARETRKALYELEMSKLELASATARKELTAKQLKLAEDGMAGIDWPGNRETLSV